MMSHTKDERFVLSLYTLAEKTGDVYAPLDRYEVGEACGLKERGVNAICALLIQANFIKKGDDQTIYLTRHGESLALRLKDEEK